MNTLHMELPGVLNWALEGFNNIYTDQKESDTKWEK